MTARTVPAADHFIAPAMTIVKCTTAPVIDGNLDDTAWRSAAEVKLQNRIASRASGQTGIDTDAFLTCDADNLYIAFKCMEPDTKHIREMETRRDGEVWSDDCVEVFLDTKIATPRYYHFAVNPKGTRFDAVAKDGSWNGEWTARSGRGKDFWTVEMAIPFKTLRVGELPWGLNLTRTRQWPAADFFSWAPMEQFFHEPEHFGSLKGLNAAFYTSLRIIEPGSFQPLVGPGNRLTLRLENRSADQRTLVLNLSVRDPDGKVRQYHSQALSLPASMAEKISIDYPLEKQGRYTLIGDVTDLDAQKPVYSFVRETIVPDFLDLRLASFYYYRQEAKMRYILSVFGTDELRKNLSLVARIRDSAGKTRDETTTVISSPFTALDMTIAKLELGDYVLEVELRREGKPFADRQAAFRKIPGFWE